MARLVARALRLGRSALIQTGGASAYDGSYRLSYLTPALLWPEPAIVVLPQPLQSQILRQAIPSLQQAMPLIKPIQVGDRWPGGDFRGLLLTSPQAWLRDRLTQQTAFPNHLPTLIDRADDLESWVQTELTVSLRASDWEHLMLAYPSQSGWIRDLRVRLTHALFQHPINPYNCYLIGEPEQALLIELYQTLLNGYAQEPILPITWQRFWQRFRSPERLAWSRLNRERGSIELHCSPADISATLSPIWTQQPVVLMGAALGLDDKASVYRARLGLSDMTCLKFAPDRHHDMIQLYLPDRLPMPNTSHFQVALLQQIRALLGARAGATELTVVIIGDVPLKAQVGAILAAEYGSRVQVEKAPPTSGILITGWDFWQQQQSQLCPPGLLIIATLPIPSLENPLVAGRVAAHKRRRQDWFKLYLLPEALSQLQRAIAPVRTRQGIVALLDNRVNHRSYGAQVLMALSPAARSSYIDMEWLPAEEAL
ncbi:ATP-dependent DNA helicase [Vasconcelosia minhoensis]|nr:ATP-dependent DNA helicase [Romeria gracilis]